ncbi:MAG: 3'(2'),5'-bisphosphate nucleotidase [Idiomarina sp.]|jgi:3'(2'), 5'-bisphosphate nucleotidase|uniref:3'(2'),5'-bisphosphate nucleotidase CysQ n=1 Tax=Idiomarina sp. TaxID=1874361 RepID=UPI000C112426|nr:3'(2'),5'-bisphosphate nucleotidase CysQ [Idiomarina sp.]MAK70833.1 3'(2'),5'-bisphosphate nucleotidase [Idiomarinaceae bacterium]MBL4742489.1 3'(2'),5'-bisphosphate nucleotidase CysQ [Idiomarina sp.]MBT43074.1 3'(2'),5'-bisphosphate nucleotidase [Idiomarina sp.]PHQ76599.1 MAG: 3'(2'),5'-bisphosphate nucleotidase [Idiomarina sp.]HAD49541.1 3'(2'),5'-bisphosphate nucleotidase [Idiomarina sp.]
MLDIVASIAREAGEQIMRLYERRDYSTYEKPDESPVTSADIAASELIIERLRQEFPDIPVLSEESEHENFQQRRQWQRYFLIDPIDGTQEFISRSGDFAVNIALVEHNQPTLGVIFWPAGNSLYAARKGEGASKTTASGSEPIRVRAMSDPQNDPIVIAISRRQARGPVLKRIQTQRELQPLPAGSCSLKACFIAEGKADCFLRLGPTGEWDTAAAEVIVSEAGGSLVNENFEPITYNKTVSLLNPNFMVLGDPRVDWEQVFIARPPRFR